MASRVLWGAVLGLVALLVVDAIAVRLGLAPGAVPGVEGLLPISRALGVTALLALTGSAVLGLLVSSRLAARLVPRPVDAHRWLSALALALTALHGVVLIADRTVRFDMLDVLVPFLSSWRPLAVGLGVVAAWAALLVHRSERWRPFLGARTWRRLHYVSYASFAAALAHGLLAGQDDGPPWLGVLYTGCALAVAGLTVVRLLGRARAPSLPPARAQ